MGFWLDVRAGEELACVVRVGLLVEDGVGVGVGSSDSSEVVCRVDVGRELVDVRRIVVDGFFVVVLGGVGGLDGRVGFVVPFVGVSTLLPSQ